MDKTYISQQAKVSNKVASNISVVKVNASNHIQAWVIESRGTEDAIVGTNIGASPISSYVKRVGEDGFLPFLKSNVSSPEPGVGKGEINFHLVFKIVGKIIGLLKGQELAVSDIRCLGIG